MKTIGRALIAIAVTVAASPSTLLGDDGAQGTQSNAASQGQNASDITASAAGDPNAIYIRWGETVEVRRGERTVENINRESGQSLVQGATGSVEKLGNSVTYSPSRRPALRCPSTSDPEIFGPCRLG